MTKKIISIAAVSTALLIACTHETKNSSEERTPAQAANAAGLVATNTNEWDEVRQMVLQKNAERFKTQFVGLRIAQSLVANFDLRLESYAKADQVDQLLGSDLYCKIQNLKNNHEIVENHLIYALKIAKQNGTEFSDWYFNQINEYLKDAKEKLTQVLDPRKGSVQVQPEYSVYVASVGNLFRTLVANEVELCGSLNCVANDLPLLSQLSINPLDSDAFGKYIKANRMSMAMSAITGTQFRKTLPPLKPGDCYEAEARRKPQAEAYDWKNRNWIGSVLPDGQFVFTYDDGPHESYTRVIRDAWASAGLPKPAFFWLRKNASNLPQIVKELNDQGYVIASHSERHTDLGNLAKAASPSDFNGVNVKVFGPEVKGLSAAQFAAWKLKTLDREILDSVKDLSAILNKPVRYFRLPFGSGVRNDLIGARFQAANLDHFFWRVDSLDWQDKNPASVHQRVLTQMRTVRKGIVLYHDIHPQSAEAAKLMAQELKTSKEFKAVSIRDIPGLKP